MFSKRKWTRVVAAVVAIAAVTFIFSRLIPLNPTTVGFAYLTMILVIATRWALLESLVASVVATLCFNYFFFPPVGTFTIADPHNWVALSAFLATSLIAGHLSEKARRRTSEALSRQTEMERLYALSRAILLTETNQPIAKQIARDVARIYQLSTVAICDRNTREIHHVGDDDISGLDKKLEEVAAHGGGLRDAAAGLTVTAIGLGGPPSGSLALKGAASSDAGFGRLRTW